MQSATCVLVGKNKLCNQADSVLHASFMEIELRANKKPRALNTKATRVRARPRTFVFLKGGNASRKDKITATRGRSQVQNFFS